MSRPVAALLAPAALLLTACGTIAGDDLEAKIEKGARPELKEVKAKLASVSCPEEVESETGAKAECTVTTKDDAELDVRVEVTDGATGEVEYKFTPGSVRKLLLGDGA